MHSVHSINSGKGTPTKLIFSSSETNINSGRPTFAAFSFVVARGTQKVMQPQRLFKRGDKPRSTSQRGTIKALRTADL